MLMILFQELGTFLWLPVLRGSLCATVEPICSISMKRCESTLFSQCQGVSRLCECASTWFSYVNVCERRWPVSNFSKSVTCYQQMKRTHHLSNPGPYIPSDIQECNYEFALHIFYPLNGVKKIQWQTLVISINCLSSAISYANKIFKCLKYCQALLDI